MRGRSPFGNPLLWIVAAVVIPEVAKKCKPLAKAIGEALVDAGEALKRTAAKKDSEECEVCVAEVEVASEESAEASAEEQPEETPAESEPAPKKKSKTAEATE